MKLRKLILTLILKYVQMGFSIPCSGYSKNEGLGPQEEDGVGRVR